MATGGPTEQADGAGGDNVIRFPRDWFGSKDDLVPFGPAADRRAAEASATPADAPAAPPTDTDEDLASALTANDFWGEASGALHQPVDVAPDEEAPGYPRSDAELPAYPVADAELTGEPQQRLSLAAGGSLRALPSAVRARRVRVSVRAAAVAGAAVVVLSLAVVAFAAAHSGSPGHRSGPAATAKLTGTQPTPADRPTGAPGGDRGLSGLSSPTVTAPDRSRARVGSTAHTKAASRAKTTRGHAKAETSRAHTTPARKSQDATRAKATRHRSVAKQHSVPRADTSSSSAARSDEGASTTAVSSSSDSTAPTDDAPATPASTPASGGTSSRAAGPGGLGGAVGSNCNPTCSSQ
jgi:hypothetical protein